MAAVAENSVESVLAQTERILGSPYLSRSQTLCRFLRFIVGLTVEGKANELKEYRLGVDVLGRGKNFDPRIDPIVRIQAAKLRSRLAEYYSSEGRDDSLVISIPKGGYVPCFTQAQAHEAKTHIPQSHPIQSIAVLPFVNMSPDPDNEYFSDGLTEELINLLTSVAGLRVVARTSVFSFKNAAKDVREIGAQLNVQTVLEGSVRKAGNQIRVTAQLVEVSSGYHLLSRAYPRELKDVFAVQEELANAVVTEIMPQVRGMSEQSLLRVRAADLTAYNLYLKGMFTLSGGFNGPRESVKAFQEVLKIDPGYGPASAGLAFAYFAMAWYGVMASTEAMPLAKAAAQNALRLDRNLALGHTILGAVQAAFEWNWEEAERSFREALALQPGLALAYQLHTATCLLAQRRLAEAICAIERALLLNPFDPLLRAGATHAYSVSGDYQAALENYSLGVEVNPKAPLLYRAMGLAHQTHGHFDKAIAAFRTACDVSARSPLAVAALGHALVTSGDRTGAEALLQEVLPSTSSLARAILYLGLGDQDEALRWLASAIEDREPYVILIPVDPRFERLRGNARFEKLLGLMGLGPITEH